MIKHIIGDGLLAGNGIFVHGCNAQGVMNSGIAKTVRENFPNAFNEYKKQQAAIGLSLGSISYAWVHRDFCIVNGITQQYYGREEGKVYISYDAIREVFTKAGKIALEENLPLSFPMIGAGLGGGDWEKIKLIIEAVVDPKVEKVLYTLAPIPTPLTEQPITRKFR